MMKKNFWMVLALIFLSGCQHSANKEEIMEVPNESYKKGLELYKEGNFKEAADEFGKIYFQHPGGELTPYAELMEAYSLYQARQYQDAVDVLENFILIHPTNLDLSYAYYLRSLCYYMQIMDVHHDQNMTMKAKQSFEELINRFPNTKYAIDARLKLDLVNDHLSGKEMLIGRYYLKRKAPIGAINRFQNIIREYQTTRYTAEALYRLVESFAILGIYDEAEKYAAVLLYNYPDSKWYKYAENIIEKRKKENHGI